MAQIREVRLVDDLDGSPGVETIEFAIDGKNYEIDLSEENATKIRDELAPFVAAGRRAGRVEPTRRSSGAVRPTTDRAQNQAIREWAIKQGMKIAERGRIPSEILDAYHEQSKAS